jgi:hypothetical protein
VQTVNQAVVAGQISDVFRNTFGVEILRRSTEHPTLVVGAPTSVHASMRVDRMISRVPIRSSSIVRWQLTEESDRPLSSAAAERLPVSMAVANKAIASMRFVVIAGRLTSQRQKLLQHPISSIVERVIRSLLTSLRRLAGQY